MDPESERHRCVAESLIALPRYLSRDKIRLFGVDGVAEIVASVIADPDENTKTFVGEQNGLRCSVCEKLKHQCYYGWNRYSEGETHPVCRYCRWRIKTKADERYRKEKGLPPKPKKEDPEERKSFLGPEQIAALDEFLLERENRPPDLQVAQVRLPEEAYSVSGVYGPGFANISSGWYSTSEDENYGSGRKQISAWWTDKHDAVIEWFLRSYGMFALAACRSIELEIKRLRGTSGDIARYFDYFVLDRIRTQRHLWNSYASDFLSRYQLKNTCALCGATEPLIWIHHENLEATTGRVLPLCNLHWKTYRRTARIGETENIRAVEIDVSLDSALRTHRCPVCETDHSWKDKTYTYNFRWSLLFREVRRFLRRWVRRRSGPLGNLIEPQIRYCGARQRVYHVLPDRRSLFPGNCGSGFSFPNAPLVPVAFSQPKRLDCAPVAPAKAEGKHEPYAGDNRRPQAPHSEDEGKDQQNAHRLNKRMHQKSDRCRQSGEANHGAGGSAP